MVIYLSNEYYYFCTNGFFQYDLSALFEINRGSMYKSHLHTRYANMYVYLRTYTCMYIYFALCILLVRHYRFVITSTGNSDDN